MHSNTQSDTPHTYTKIKLPTQSECETRTAAPHQNITKEGNETHRS